MTIKAIDFEMATERNDVRFAINNAAESCNPRLLKHLARFDFIKHRHHVLAPRLMKLTSAQTIANHFN